MLTDDDIRGRGNSYDFGARNYDPRLGRFMSLDPYKGMYPGISNYTFAANSPISFLDYEGKYIYIYNSNRSIGLALDILYHTEMGKKLIDEYWDNPDKHIYLNSANLHHAYGFTIPATFSSYSKDYKRDKNIYLGLFSSQGTFDFTDFGKLPYKYPDDLAAISSAWHGQPIMPAGGYNSNANYHFVVFDNQSDWWLFGWHVSKRLTPDLHKNLDIYELMAQTVYHEIWAHIHLSYILKDYFSALKKNKDLDHDVYEGNVKAGNIDQKDYKYLIKYQLDNLFDSDIFKNSIFTPAFNKWMNIDFDNNGMIQYKPADPLGTHLK